MTLRISPRPVVGEGCVEGAFLDIQSPKGAVLSTCARFAVERGLAVGSRLVPGEIDASRSPQETEFIRVLIPGFCNPHSHLELTSTAGLIEPTPRFTDWAPQLFAWKQANGPEAMAEGVRRGLRLCLEGGVTAIGDTVSTPEAARALGEASIPAVAYCEALAPCESRVDEAYSAFVATFGAALDIQESPRAAPFFAGLSPHAPHTVAKGLSQLLRKEHGENKFVSIHAAETRAELEFLQAKTGEFAEFFRGLELLEEGPPLEASPVERLDDLGWLPPFVGSAPPEPLGYFERVDSPAPPLDPYTILAHGNYLSPAEVELLAPRRVAVCWCPETHAYFGHEPYPLAQNRRLPLLLGTDSLASAWSLSPLDQMRRALRSAADWGVPWRASEALYAATLGARDAVFGRTAESPRADFTVLSVPSASLLGGESEWKPEGDIFVSNDILRSLLLDDRTTVAGTIVGGRIAWSGDSDFSGAPPLTPPKMPDA